MTPYFRIRTEAAYKYDLSQDSNYKYTAFFNKIGKEILPDYNY